MMDMSEIGVVTGGVLLVGFILWYFFGEPDKPQAAANDDGVQD